MYFVETLFTNPVRFFSTVMIVVGSITLHEWFHALAATWEGDDTPAKAGRLTLNPLVHMGWTSLIFLAVAGIAWGATPVKPENFRHRWGNAWVSFAGPLSNLLLLLFCAVLMGVLTPVADPSVLRFLYLAALLNGVLFLLNMLPVPPLDGFGILETFVPGLRHGAAGLAQYGFLVLIVAFFVLGLGSYLFGASEWLVERLYLMFRLP